MVKSNETPGTEAVIFLLRAKKVGTALWMPNTFSQPANWSVLRLLQMKQDPNTSCVQ